MPGGGFETDWADAGTRLRALLRHGDHIALHCLGGLGRTGMIAVRLLVELGIGPSRLPSSRRWSVSFLFAVWQQRLEADESPAAN